MHVSDLLKSEKQEYVEKVTTFSWCSCHGGRRGRNGRWGKHDDDPELADGTVAFFCSRGAGDDDEIDVTDGKGEDRRVWRRC